MRCDCSIHKVTQPGQHDAILPPKSINTTHLLHQLGLRRGRLLPCNIGKNEATHW